MLGLLAYHVIRLKTCTPLSSISMLGWLKPNSLKFLTFLSNSNVPLNPYDGYSDPLLYIRFGNTACEVSSSGI